ncbi:MAG: hypothetical protein IT204_01755 [Fimbriimonadaceae bacterium]|nr:hypothetical protein [Fimbriimonadaceae bacterium]
MIVGTGAYRYEWQGEWAQVPPGVELGYTHGVVEDAQGRILVHNQSRDAVAIFDAAGHYLRSWGAEFAAGAHGFVIHQESAGEFLYLADYARHLVVKTTPDGEEVLRLAPPPRTDLYESIEQYKPTDVTVAPNGDLFVFDGYGLSWIHKYSASGEYLSSFGGRGSEPGQVSCPHSGKVDTRGTEPVLLVADRSNVRIQIFDLEGHHLGFQADELRYPCGFWLCDEYTIVPDLHGRVSLFDRQWKLLCHLGDQPGVWQRPGWPNLPPEQRPVGQFNSPHAACADRAGNLFVVEWISDGRITKLAKVG